MSVITKFDISTVTSHMVIAVMSGISDSVTGLGPTCRSGARGTDLGTRCSLQGKMMILDLGWRSPFRPFLSH